MQIASPKREMPKDGQQAKKKAKPPKQQPGQSSSLSESDTMAGELLRRELQFHPDLGVFMLFVATLTEKSAALHVSFVRLSVLQMR